MLIPRSIPRIFTVIIFSLIMSGCASDGSLKRWGQCALIGGGTGGLVGAAIDGASAGVGGLAAGALLGGLICAFTDKDSDADGISDSNDLCPNTPHDISVGESGCPLDSDNDGVADYKDLCPDTRAGATVNADGCPDSDHDGISDNRDECPNTPAGVMVDTQGCPIDSDHDGIPDGLDKCPGTTDGSPVDSQGCYLKVPENLGEVHFRFDGENINTESKQLLDSVIAKMNKNPNLNIKVFGYADSSGQPSYNIQLSQRRADSVKAYMVAQGIDTRRIKALAAGVVPDHNDTESGRSSNRKASLITDTEE